MNEGPEIRDIHLPADSLWWPPAPGWWSLLILAVGALLLYAWLRRRRRHPPLRRLTRRELEAIRREYAAGRSDPSAVTAALTRLLRRTLIGYRGRRAAAASTGGDWLSQLEQLAPGNAFSDEQLRYLARDRYRPGGSCDIEALLQACDTWIRNLPREPRHAAD